MSFRIILFSFYLLLPVSVLTAIMVLLQRKPCIVVFHKPSSSLNSLRIAIKSRVVPGHLHHHHLLYRSSERRSDISKCHYSYYWHNYRTELIQNLDKKESLLCSRTPASGFSVGFAVYGHHHHRKWSSMQMIKELLS